MIDDHAPTEIRPRYPLPPAPARGPVQPSPLTAVGTHLQYLAGTALAPLAPHPVDVRRPRHALLEDITQPSWWAREWTHILAGLVGGALLLVLAAVVYVVGAVLR